MQPIKHFITFDNVAALAKANIIVSKFKFKSISGHRLRFGQVVSVGSKDSNPLLRSSDILFSDARPHTRNDYYNLNCLGKKKAVLRIRDVYPGSRILIFTHPGSRIQKQ